MSQGPPPIPENGPLLTATTGTVDTSYVRTDGKVLEVGQSGQPPTEFCIKSGRPSDVVKTREFSYIHPAFYLTILAGILPFLIFVLLFRKTIRFEVGMCSYHYRKHLLMVALGVLGSLLGLGVLFYTLAVEKYSLALIGVALFLAVGVPGILLSRILRPVNVNDQRGIFKGAGAEYLEKLSSE